MLSSKERNIYIAIILIVIAWVFYLSTSNQPDYSVKYVDKIKTLNLKVDSLDNINRGLTLKVDSLNKQVTIINHQIDLKDSKIKTLKNRTNTKVKAVDFFNDDELTKFFTDRYRHYLDSIEKTHSSPSN